MRELIVQNNAITEDPFKILEDIRSELMNGKLAIVTQSGGNIKVTCPFHSGGMEKHPSAYLNLSNEDIPFLWFHCFTDGESCSFSKFVGECFDKSEEWGAHWLLSHYDHYSLDDVKRIHIDDISLKKEEKKVRFMNDNILDGYASYHPYMTQRGISDEVIKKFGLKYDHLSKMIVFPIRDASGNLVALSRRSVEGKKFYIDHGFDKSNLYGLDQITYDKPVYLVESQFNCLTLWTYGYQSLCLFGAGVTDDQVEVLNRLPVKYYIVALDPDQAGYKGTAKLCRSINKLKFVDVLLYNISGKDINDLSKEEFESLETVSRFEFLDLYNKHKLI